MNCWCEYNYNLIRGIKEFKKFVLYQENKSPNEERRWYHET